MSGRKLTWVLAVLLIGVWAGAEDQTPAPVVKHVPIKATSPVSGHDMYTAYCAVCHGKDGKGAGPAAAALKFLHRSHGSEQEQRREISLRPGDRGSQRHGGSAGAWLQRYAGLGTAVLELSHGSEGEVQLRMQNLTKYIKSLQEK